MLSTEVIKTIRQSISLGITWGIWGKTVIHIIEVINSKPDLQAGFVFLIFFTLPLMGFVSFSIIVDKNF